MSQRIAFIGLGHMGSGMAANLAKAGHAVAAFDLSAAALDRAIADGCTRADSAAAAVAGAEAVVTMLPAGRHVAQVYGEQVFDAAEPNAIIGWIGRNRRIDIVPMRISSLMFHATQLLVRLRTIRFDR